MDEVGNVLQPSTRIAEEGASLQGSIPYRRLREPHPDFPLQRREELAPLSPHRHRLKHSNINLRSRRMRPFCYVNVRRQFRSDLQKKGKGKAALDKSPLLILLRNERLINANVHII